MKRSPPSRPDLRVCTQLDVAGVASNDRGHVIDDATYAEIL